MVVDETKVSEFVKGVGEAFYKLNYAEQLEACAGLIVASCSAHNVRGPELAKQAAFLVPRIIDLEVALIGHHVAVASAQVQKATREARGEKDS